MSRPTHRDACQAFRWEDSLRAMGIDGHDRVNLGHVIVDRHAGSGRRALEWFGRHGEPRTYTFDELAGLTGRFAGVLRARGLVKRRLGRHQFPREIEFLDQLPKTETGKIQRFLLRAR
jgi:acyl-coenzyme A synthetase/AMP-(fatty) acid ligase